MLRTRIVTAVISLAVIGLVVFVIPPAAAEIVIAVLITAGAWEWSAFLGRQVTLRIAYTVLVAACLAVIALSAWLNVALSLRWRTSVRINERYAAALLAYDLIQLAVLLYLTGGLENPFSFLFLVPVLIIIGALLWLVTTPAGFQFALNAATKLSGADVEFDNLQGTFTGDIKADRLVYRDDTLTVSIEEFSTQINLFWLLDARVAFDETRIKKASIALSGLLARGI